MALWAIHGSPRRGSSPVANFRWSMHQHTSGGVSKQKGRMFPSPILGSVYSCNSTTLKSSYCIVRTRTVFSSLDQEGWSLQDRHRAQEAGKAFCKEKGQHQRRAHILKVAQQSSTLSSLLWLMQINATWPKLCTLYAHTVCVQNAVVSTYSRRHQKLLHRYKNKLCGEGRQWFQSQKAGAKSS